MAAKVNWWRTDTWSCALSRSSRNPSKTPRDKKQKPKTAPNTNRTPTHKTKPHKPKNNTHHRAVTWQVPVYGWKRSIKATGDSLVSSRCMQNEVFWWQVRWQVRRQLLWIEATNAKLCCNHVFLIRARWLSAAKSCSQTSRELNHHRQSRSDKSAAIPTAPRLSCSSGAKM